MRIWGAIILFCLFAMLVIASEVDAKTYVVNTIGDEENADVDSDQCKTAFSTPDHPRCTLRAAIQAADFSPGSDVIEFDIPPEECFFGSFCTIQLLKPLPPLRPRFDVHPRDIASLTINAARAECTPATPCIVVDGGLLTGTAASQEEIDQRLSEGLRFRERLVRAWRGLLPFPALVQSYSAEIERLAEVFSNGHPLKPQADGLRLSGLEAAARNDVAAALDSFQRLLELVPLAPGHCLYIDSNNNTILGLIVSRCPGDGIEVHGSGNLIQGAKAGTDAEGLDPEGNRGSGIRILGLAGSFDPAPCPFQNARCRGNPSVAVASFQNWIRENVLSGNHRYGLEVIGRLATLNHIEGNKIGVNRPGNKPLANRKFGVFLGREASKNFLGDEDDSTGNIIGGNNEGGVHIDNSNENELRKNFIGTEILGAARLGNSGPGVLITGDSQLNRIGTPGRPRMTTGNIIAFNSEDGIRIVGGSASFNTISGNSIYLNGNGTDFKGIKLEAGANLGIPAPANLQLVTITPQPLSGNRLFIEGTTQAGLGGPCRNCVVEVFSDAGEFAQPAGNGRFSGVQGRFYEGFVVTDAKGNFRFDVEPAGRFVTATVTDHLGNTSEFSLAIDPKGSLGQLAPTVDDVVPSEGRPGQRLTVRIFGENFTDDICPDGVSFGAGIEVTSCTVNRSVKITVEIRVLADAAVGPRVVSVTNAAGATGQWSGRFVVLGSRVRVEVLRPGEIRCRRAGSFSVLLLRVTNEGSTPVVLEGVQETNPNFDLFRVIPSPNLPERARTLQPGRPRPILLQLRCTTVGTFRPPFGITLEFSDGPVALAAPDAPQPSEELSVGLVHGLLQVRARRSDVSGLRVQIFNMSGQLLFERQTHASRLLALMRDPAGRPWANGVYLVVVVIERTDGTSQREIHVLAAIR